MGVYSLRKRQRVPAPRSTGCKGHLFSDPCFCIAALQLNSFLLAAAAHNVLDFPIQYQAIPKMPPFPWGLERRGNRYRGKLRPRGLTPPWPQSKSLAELGKQFRTPDFQSPALNTRHHCLYILFALLYWWLINDVIISLPNASVSFIT